MLLIPDVGEFHYGWRTNIHI